MIALPNQLSAARNYNLAVTEREGQVIFLRRLMPGGTDRSYGLYVARLAGVPPSVVDHAAEVLARWEQFHTEDARLGIQRASSLVPRTRALREVGDGLLVPADDEVVWQVICELYSLDIANLTPVQALVMLNEWQGRLRRAE